MSQEITIDPAILEGRVKPIFRKLIAGLSADARESELSEDELECVYDLKETPHVLAIYEEIDDGKRLVNYLRESTNLPFVQAILTAHICAIYDKDTSDSARELSNSHYKLFHDIFAAETVSDTLVKAAMSAILILKDHPKFIKDLLEGSKGVLADIFIDNTASYSDKYPEIKEIFACLDELGSQQLEPVSTKIPKHPGENIIDELLAIKSGKLSRHTNPYLPHSVAKVAEDLYVAFHEKIDGATGGFASGRFGREILPVAGLEHRYDYGENIFIKKIKQLPSETEEDFKERVKAEFGPTSAVYPGSRYLIVEQQKAPGLLKAYIFMPYFDGNELFDVINENIMTKDRKKITAMNVMQAVDDVHSLGILHRDLKPENIMILADAAKVVDFGFAVYMKDAPNKFKPIGSVAYLSPRGWLMGEGQNLASEYYAISYCLGLLFFGPALSELVLSPQTRVYKSLVTTVRSDIETIIAERELNIENRKLVSGLIDECFTEINKRIDMVNGSQCYPAQIYFANQGLLKELIKEIDKYLNEDDLLEGLSLIMDQGFGGDHPKYDEYSHLLERPLDFASYIHLLDKEGCEFTEQEIFRIIFALDNLGTSLDIHSSFAVLDRLFVVDSDRDKVDDYYDLYRGIIAAEESKYQSAESRASLIRDIPRLFKYSHVVDLAIQDISEAQSSSQGRIPQEFMPVYSSYLDEQLCLFRFIYENKSDFELLEAFVNRDIETVQSILFEYGSTLNPIPADSFYAELCKDSSANQAVLREIRDADMLDVEKMSSLFARLIGDENLLPSNTLAGLASQKGMFSQAVVTDLCDNLMMPGLVPG
ncbi:MAG: hypothetical protein JXR42_04740 [Gammaproteobacteria bacterium]|nr:hypothetical protein [Gammaproteobacteria bacterium]